jgi:hypothetical protein
VALEHLAGRSFQAPPALSGTCKSAENRLIGFCELSCRGAQSFPAFPQNLWVHSVCRRSARPCCGGRCPACTSKAEAVPFSTAGFKAKAGLTTETRRREDRTGLQALQILGFLPRSVARIFRRARPQARGRPVVCPPRPRKIRATVGLKEGTEAAWYCAPYLRASSPDREARRDGWSIRIS